MKYKWWNKLDDATKEFLENNGCFPFGVELNFVYKADRKRFDIERWLNTELNICYPVKNALEKLPNVVKVTKCELDENDVLHIELFRKAFGN